MTRRIAVPVLAVLCAAVLSACGQVSPGAGASGDPAAALPADTLLYGQIDLDRSSAGWQNMQHLGARFPGWTKLVAEVRRGLATTQDGSSFTNDIEPWLGNDAAFGVTGVDLAGAQPSPSFVVYAAVKDSAALERAVAEPESHLRHTGAYRSFQEYRQTNGDHLLAATGDDAFYLASDSRTLRDAIDAHQSDAPTLAAKRSFRAAMTRLPQGALARGYVDVDGIRPLLALAGRFGGANIPGGAAQLRRAIRPLHAVSFSLGAEHAGLRAAAVVIGDPAKLTPGAGHATPLADRVPADALFYAGATQTPGDLLVKQGIDAAGVKELRAATGIDPVRDLMPLFDGQFAAYASPRSLSAALLLRPRDAGAAAAALRRITASATRDVPGVRVADTGSGQRVRLGSGVTLTWRRSGDVIGLGNDPSAPGIRTPDLSTQPALRRVLREAGVGVSAHGLLYLDVPALVRILPVAANGRRLRPLGALVGWTTVETGAATSQLFLEVR